MKRVSLFGANFEDSKKIVTSGKYSLTAGMPNPIHMSLLNRLFTVGFCMFFAFGIVGYFISIHMPSNIGLEGEVYYISYASTVLIRSMAVFLKPISLLFYLTYLFASIPVFWPKKRLSSQVFTYFPFYFPWASSVFLAVFYLASAAAFDAYTMLGFWLQLIVGIALFIWIIVNSIQNLKRRLNDEVPIPILKKVLLMILGMMILLFVVSLVYHQVNKLPILWYFYLFGLLLIVLFVAYAYLVAFLINVHIVQAYYIHKYPMEYKEYLGISDREWYSKRYYKKLIKSGQLEEE
jgi:membrane protein